MTFPKPCLTCGTLAIGSYCPKHQQEKDAPRIARRREHLKATGQYAGDYPRLAKIIRETATVCALCGNGWNINDPFEADHIKPGTRVTDISQLQAVHRSCNLRKSNKG